MIAACVVWSCNRPTVDASGTFCERHAPEWEREGPTSLDADADHLAYALAEGMTLAEVAAVTA